MNGQRERICFRSGPALARRAFLLIGAAVCLTGVARVHAHPLGNDSITHFNVLYVLPDRLELDYLVDIAENPAQVIEAREMDRDKDGKVTRDEQEAWLESKLDQYAALLTARINGEDLKFSLVPEQTDPGTGRKMTTSKVIVPMAGPMGMTYRLVIRYMARYPQPPGSGENLIQYEDKTYPQQVGLKLVLLEPTPFLCRLYDLPAGSVHSGPVSAELEKALSDEALAIKDKEAARIFEAPATPSGQRRWILSDGEQQFALVEQPDCIEVTRVPYCEVLEPHPPFVSEDNAAFRYEQYDPMNLPDNRSASIRFRVVQRQGTAASAPAAVAQAGAATQPDAASRGAGSDESTSPAANRLAPYANSFLDPAYNPVQTSEYQRQAQKMIGLLQGEWGFILLLVVTGTAFAWGAAHALMPGHAKTVVAAYLISQRGTYWHAFVLAIIVTVTHTALVVIMGLVIWYFQSTNPRLAPKIQLWLGLIAGVLVVSMGMTLLWRAVSGRIAAHGHEHGHEHEGPDDRPWWRKLFTHSHPHLPDHDHSHAHGHDHGDGHSHSHSHDHGHAHALAHSHDHDHGHHHDHSRGHVHVHDHGHTHSHSRQLSTPRAGADQLTFRMLLVLGVTGGIVPCPSATIIMFLGIGAKVIGGALYAIAVFSLGLALTLMLIGSMALASRRFAAKVMSDARSEQDLSGPGRKILLQIIPAISGLAVSTLGGMIAFHYICLMRNVPSPFPWMG